MDSIPQLSVALVTISRALDSEMSNMPAHEVSCGALCEVGGHGWVGGGWVRQLDMAMPVASMCMTLHTVTFTPAQGLLLCR